MVVIPAIAEGAALTLAIWPFLRHKIDMHAWMKNHSAGHHPPSKEPVDEALTILLPVWNEALLIEEKLANTAAQTIPCSLLLIDSASTDDTLQLSRDWLALHPEAFLSVEILEMNERKGKSAAVQHALAHLEQSKTAGLVCMTDADALLQANTMNRMMRWFHDPMIGVVGALPLRRHARMEETTHRQHWDAMRLAESSVDSTPFLEGSCMMWRINAMSSGLLNTQANADDAQIATEVRLQGRRCVVDPTVSFSDGSPQSGPEQRRQKIRRAQGLQRLLVRRRKASKNKRLGVFSTILRRQFHFHITAPLLVGVAVISALLRWVFIALYGWPATFTLANSVHLGLTFSEATMVILWWRARSGRSSGPFSLIGQWLASMELLMRSLKTSAQGRSLHMWEQHQDARETFVANKE